MKYVAALILSSILVGCGSVTPDQTELPFGVTNLTTQGNGWYTFKWHGECFLYQRSVYDRSQNTTLTSITCPNDTHK